MVDAWRIDDLRRQLLRDGPVDDNGQVHSGLTSSVIEPRYVLDPIPPGCRMLALRVRVDITTYLPSWQPRRKPVAKVAKAWERASSALVEHEHGHRRHVLAAADELLVRLRELPDMADCRSLEIAAKRVLDRVLLKLNARTRLFDQATDFGRLPLQSSTNRARK